MTTKSPIGFASRLHEAGAVYVFYGAIDGLSLSYSMIKYLFDLLFTTGEISSSDAMHDWMMSQEGMETVAATSISLVVFSMLANHFSDNDENSFKRYMAVVWPYCREAMKGLKNGYKGIRSTFQAFELLNLGQDLRHLIVPMSLLLGGLSVLNRIWFRTMIGQYRKDMMKANTTLWDGIRKKSLLTEEEIAVEREKIQSHSAKLRAKALFSAAYGGIVDGLYLYVGVLSICSLAPVVLQAMSVFCAVYFVTCVATRIYEEYNFQRLLCVTEARVELALRGKKIELLVSQLASLSRAISETNEEEAKLLVLQQKQLAENLTKAMEAFKCQRETLRSLSTLSYPAAVLAGLGNGLAAYGAIASAMFATSALLLLASTPFPPNLLVGCILLGVVCLTGFVAQSVNVAHQHYIAKQKENLFDDELPGVFRILSTLKEENKLACDAENLVTIQKAVADGLNVERLPQSVLQAWLEVVRSFFSGIGKGTKAVGFTLYCLQEVDEHGDYHDTPLMVKLMIASAAAHSLILALRAYARGLGRPPVDAVEEKPPIKEPTGSIGDGIPVQPPNQPPKERSRFAFFYEQQQQKNKLLREGTPGFRSTSTPDLHSRSASTPHVPGLLVDTVVPNPGVESPQSSLQPRSSFSRSKSSDDLTLFAVKEGAKERAKPFLDDTNLPTYLM